MHQDQHEVSQYHLRMRLVFAALFSIPIVHLVLILCSYGTIASVLRPIGTAGAAVTTLYLTRQATGRKQIACLLLGCSLASSSLFSIFKIIYDVTVSNPAMRWLWFIVYGAGICGAILYIAPSKWSIARVANTIRIALGGVSVGLVMYTLLYTALYYRDQSLQWNDARIINTPTIAIDAAILYILGLLYVDQRVNKAVLISVLLLFVADFVHLYMMLAGTFPIQGRSSSLFPIYTAQSVLLAFAVYQDLYRDVKAPFNSQLEWLLWSVLPIACAFVAGVTSMIVPTAMQQWVVVGSFVIIVIHAAITGYDYYRALQRQQMMTVREREARIMMRAFQHELRGHVTALSGLLPIIRATVPVSNTIDLLDSSVRDMQTMVNQVLLFGSDQRVPETQMQRIPVRSYLEELCARVGYSQVSVAVESYVEVYCNQMLLELFLRNAITNAIEAGGSNVIQISAYHVGEATCIQVQDNGCGFEPHLLHTITQRRLHDGMLQPGLSSKEGIRGLGLAFMDHIARLHRGTFVFGNLPHGGGFVTLELPQPGT